MIEVSVLLYTPRAEMYSVSPKICRIESSRSSSRKTFFCMPSTIWSTSSVASSTWHMCTAVVDVQSHNKMEVVDLGDDITKSHRNVHVTMEGGTVRPCQGAIDIQHLLGVVSVERGNYHCQNFLQHLPLQFKEFNWSNAEKSFKE